MISIEMNGTGRVKVNYPHGDYVHIYLQEQGSFRRDAGPGSIKLLLNTSEFWDLFLEIKAVAEVLWAAELAEQAEAAAEEDA
jgi:hypothetical protein